MSKAIFLDRDGTINKEVNYLKSADELEIFPGTIKALQKFKNLGFKNIIITNQSGIARGYLSEIDLEKIHNKLLELLNKDSGNLIDDIFHSPFHPDGIIEKYKSDSPDRKPGTGMIEKAMKKHSIELQESFIIGDSFTDMLCGKNAGLKKILVLTGYGKEALSKCREENIEIDYAAADLLDASLFIEKNFTGKKRFNEII